MLLLWPLLLFLLSLVLTMETPTAGEYYISSFFGIAYKKAGFIVFFLAALFIGMFTNVRPVLAGLTVILFFGAISIYEGEKYKGSHNLIPFEFIIFAVYCLPVVVGVIAGNFIRKARNRPAARD